MARQNYWLYEHIYDKNNLIRSGVRSGANSLSSYKNIKARKDIFREKDFRNVVITYFGSPYQVITWLRILGIEKSYCRYTLHCNLWIEVSFPIICAGMWVTTTASSKKILIPIVHSHIDSSSPPWSSWWQLSLRSQAAKRFQTSSPKLPTSTTSPAPTPPYPLS